jgi:hypothetical protein
MTPVENLARHADVLLDLLVDAGPLTSAEICDKLGWPKGRVGTAVRYAREHLCPTLGLAIPAPTPAEGWIYQVTTDWEPVEAGAAYTLGHVESRLIGIHRDVRVVLPHITRGTKEWRRANFLNKHLAHLIATLAEIDK